MSQWGVQNPFALSLNEKVRFFFLLFLEQILGKTSVKEKVQKYRESFFNDLKAKFDKLPDAGRGQIQARSALDVDEFKNGFFKNSEPVVYRGAAKDWPCCKKWDLNYFKDAVGKKNVLLVDINGLTSKKSETGFEILPVSDLVTNIREGGEKYLRFSPLLQHDPGLVKDLNLDWLGRLKSRWSIGVTYYLFMGGKGTVTHLHCDQPCNLFIQVYGRKKWTLISVDQSHMVYPQATQTAYFKSEADLGIKLNEKHSLINKAKKWEVILEPGDILYIPPHVWHYVENLSETIAVGYRFSSIAAAIRSSGIFTFLRFCAQNPPMWKTRKYGKVDTNLIWADANGSNVSEIIKKMKS